MKHAIRRLKPVLACLTLNHHDAIRLKVRLDICLRRLLLLRFVIIRLSFQFRGRIKLCYQLVILVIVLNNQNGGGILSSRCLLVRLDRQAIPRVINTVRQHRHRVPAARPIIRSQLLLCTIQLAKILVWWGLATVIMALQGQLHLHSALLLLIVYVTVSSLRCLTLF